MPLCLCCNVGGEVRPQRAESNRNYIHDVPTGAKMSETGTKELDESIKYWSEENDK